MEDLKEILFPHDKIRKIQDTVVNDVYRAIKDKRNMIVHAPTGIGKTASVLAPNTTQDCDRYIKTDKEEIQQ